MNVKRDNSVIKLFLNMQFKTTIPVEKLRQDLFANPLPPSRSSRCRSETEENILENLFSSVLSKLKKNITPLDT